MVVFNHKQVIIDSLKHCKSTVTTDGRGHLLIQCLKPNQPYVAALHWLKWLYYVVFQERQDPSETSEGAIVNNGSHIQLRVTCRPTGYRHITDTLPTHYQSIFTE